MLTHEHKVENRNMENIDLMLLNLFFMPITAFPNAFTMQRLNVKSYIENCGFWFIYEMNFNTIFVMDFQFNSCLIPFFFVCGFSGVSVVQKREGES